MKQPFHAYSPFNKRGGKPHPAVTRMRNSILDLWAEMADYETICEKLDISRTTVVDCIKRAREMGDPRAHRPYRHKNIMRGDTRRRQIAMLDSQGVKKREIAKRLGISPRLVEIRLKEKA